MGNFIDSNNCARSYILYEGERGRKKKKEEERRKKKT